MKTSPPWESLQAKIRELKLHDLPITRRKWAPSITEVPPLAQWVIQEGKIQRPQDRQVITQHIEASFACERRAVAHFLLYSWPYYSPETIESTFGTQIVDHRAIRRARFGRKALEQHQTKQTHLLSQEGAQIAAELDHTPQKSTRLYCQAPNAWTAQEYAENLEKQGKEPPRPAAFFETTYDCSPAQEKIQKRDPKLAEEIAAFSQRFHQENLGEVETEAQHLLHLLEAGEWDLERKAIFCAGHPDTVNHDAIVTTKNLAQAVHEQLVHLCGSEALANALTNDYQAGELPGGQRGTMDQLSFFSLILNGGYVEGLQHIEVDRHHVNQVMDWIKENQANPMAKARYFVYPSSRMEKALHHLDNKETFRMMLFVMNNTHALYRSSAPAVFVNHHTLAQSLGRTYSFDELTSMYPDIEKDTYMLKLATIFMPDIVDWASAPQPLEAKVF